MINMLNEPRFNPWEEKYDREKIELGTSEERRKILDMLSAGKSTIECMNNTTMTADEFLGFLEEIGEWERVNM